MEKIKVKKNKFAEILAEFTENMCRESQYRSIVQPEQSGLNNSKKIEFEILILNMFIIVWLCQIKKFPKDLLDFYTINMYEKILPLIPEEIKIGLSKFGNASVTLPQETLLAAFEQEWLNERFTTYYKAMKNLDTESGVWEIGKIIVRNLGGDVSRPVSIMKAMTSFFLSLKHIGNYLDNFEIEQS